MISVAVPSIGAKELEYAIDAIKSGWISSQGKYVNIFEEKFADYCGTKFGASVANGTAALHLALIILGIGKGDEVIVPALTYIAVPNAVTYTGAKPVFVDSEPSTWCIDPAKIEEKISPRTKAIIPVHLYGHPADMDLIMAIAKKHGLRVIEDAAEAHGAEYLPAGRHGKGRKVGGIGDIGIFSFYGNKIITTGEGGMLVTNNLAWHEKGQFLKNQAMSKEKKYVHSEIGFNYRMTNVQAAIGLAQLEKLDAFITQKRAIAQQYNQLLAGVKGISLPPEAAWAKNIYWMYSILVQDDFAVSRDELMAKLQTAGVETRPFFTCVHKQPPYLSHGHEVLPVAEKLSLQGINLPSSVILTDKEIGYICSVIKSFS